MTCLMIAVVLQDVAAVRVLLNFDPDPRVKNAAAQNVFHAAAIVGNAEIMRLLVQKYTANSAGVRAVMGHNNSRLNRYVTNVIIVALEPNIIITQFLILSLLCCLTFFGQHTSVHPRLQPPPPPQPRGVTLFTSALVSFRGSHWFRFVGYSLARVSISVDILLPTKCCSHD